MIPTRLRMAGGLAAVVSLCACAGYGSAGAEPVPMGNGVYMIGGEPGRGSGAGFESQGYQRAIRLCFEQGKQLLRLDGQPGMPQPAAGGMQFRCVGPGEPGWKEPVG